MFIQAPWAPIMAFHFLFIFWAAMWNPCWKWRDHLFRNQEWEGSALELFKGLQTLLITFKVVFLKALFNELCTQPLLKSIASNKFWSQRLNAKLFISTWQSQSLFCVVIKSNSSGIWGSVSQGTLCAHSLSDPEHTDFTTEFKLKQGEGWFPILSPFW